MKQLNILILYKDKKYKTFSAEKISQLDLSDSDIQTIFIPLYDNLSTYIPVKPSSLYSFSKATVSIIYQAFIYDVEDSRGDSYNPNTFHCECNNIVEFINAIYNCYKFRGINLYMDENAKLDTDRTMSFIMTLRHIHIKFYNHHHQLINEIESEVFKDLSEYKSEDFYKSPPPYICENRLDCLKDILYIPHYIHPNTIADVEKLPVCIQLSDDKHWRKVKKPGRDLVPTDCVLYKIPDFEVYYIMHYDIYESLIGIKPFTIDFSSVPISVQFDNDYLTSLDNHRIPSILEKREAIEAYFERDLFSISNTSADIDHIDTFLQSLIFFKSIMGYIKYYGKYCYAGESSAIKMRTFAIFFRVNVCNEPENGHLITDLELQDEIIVNTFLKMLFKEGEF